MLNTKDKKDPQRKRGINYKSRKIRCSVYLMITEMGSKKIAIMFWQEIIANQ